jgi:hypothetical protein
MLGLNTSGPRLARSITMSYCTQMVVSVQHNQHVIDFSAPNEERATLLSMVRDVKEGALGRQCDEPYDVQLTYPTPRKQGFKLASLQSPAFQIICTDINQNTNIHLS